MIWTDKELRGPFDILKDLKDFCENNGLILKTYRHDSLKVYDVISDILIVRFRDDRQFFNLKGSIINEYFLLDIKRKLKEYFEL